MSGAETPERGGVEWELRTTLQMIASARAGGDFAAEAIGWLRFSEAQRNLVVAELARQQVRVLEVQQQTIDDRKSDAAGFEHNIGLLLRLAEQEQASAGIQDAQIGLLGIDHQKLLDLAAQIAVLAAKVAAQEASLARDASGARAQIARDAATAREVVTDTAEQARQDLASEHAGEAAADVNTEH